MPKNRLLDHFGPIPSVDTWAKVDDTLPERLSQLHLPWYFWYAFALDAIGGDPRPQRLFRYRLHATRIMLSCQKNPWNEIEMAVLGRSRAGNYLSRLNAGEACNVDRIRPFIVHMSRDSLDAEEITRMATWANSGRTTLDRTVCGLFKLLPNHLTAMVKAMTIHAHIIRETSRVRNPDRPLISVWPELDEVDFLCANYKILYNLKLGNPNILLGIVRVHHAAKILGPMFNVTTQDYSASLPYIRREHLPDGMLINDILPELSNQQHRLMMSFIYDCNNRGEACDIDNAARDVKFAFQEVQRLLDIQEVQSLKHKPDHFKLYHPWFILNGALDNAIMKYPE